MARIRSIKPEFPQSETIGKLSRDARLLFIQLWTVVDDSGRTRAASRMLASLLYPYDDDAPKLIDGWLAELEDEGCIRRYVAEGSQYLDIPNWLKHQKIDKPSASKIPEFVEPSTRAREGSRSLATDLGSRTLDQDQDQGSSSLRSDEPRAKPPDPDAPDHQAEFDRQFWPPYPHKVGKPAALKAFIRARKAHDLDAILFGLAAYVADKPAERSWLNPATFLNQERFNDQPASTANQPRAGGKPSAHDAIHRALAEEFAPRSGLGGGSADADAGLFDEPGAAPDDRGPRVDLAAGDYRRHE